ncbi:unnamed protein product [Moneuplotes crassus]|uniref:AP2/ERF domain-containing protein n=1 Tax=Euplotes crassus TaxID=5936 RepID=A0AAD1YA81_EUPCR|nr:unnamed protein product [Moneuplotes crassus]
MDFENPFAYGTLILHPMWDYESVLRELEQTKNCCPFGHDCDLNSERVCNLHGLQIPSTSESQERGYHQILERSIQRSLMTSVQQHMQRKKQKIETLMDHQNSQALTEQSDENSDALPEALQIRNRRRRAKRLNITSKLIKLRDKILTNRVSSFNRTMKQMRSPAEANLYKRSQYIGVSKSSTHWQALINVKRVKKYIGTFVNEIQAAKIYDLHAVAMQGQNAALNFDYTPQEMLETVDNYLKQQSTQVHH